MASAELFPAGAAVSIARFTTALVDAGLVAGRFEARELVSHLTGIAYAEVACRLADTIVIDQKATAVIRRLAAHEPLAYILNNRHFAGLDLFVDDRVLIPRMETEFLVEKVLADTPDHDAPLRIVDVCSGSGSILFALLSRLNNAVGIGLDVSPGAIEVARLNADRLGVADRVRFLRADALGAPLPFSPGSFDVFTCNPPYIDPADMDDLEPSVMYEPRGALEAPEAGLAFYKKLLPEASHMCKTGGLISFEIGAFQSDSVGDILRAQGVRPEFTRDIAGIERVVSWKN